jgi:hypothetical protein
MRQSFRGEWCELIERSMRAVFVVASRIPNQDLLQMRPTQDEESVGAFSTGDAYELLGRRVC